MVNVVDELLVEHPANGRGYARALRHWVQEVSSSLAMNFFALVSGTKQRRSVLGKKD